MKAVLPFYEEAVSGAFYNQCVVAAVRAILAKLPPGSQVIILEIGAGTCGTASSLLPVLQDSCSRYVYTDVSRCIPAQGKEALRRIRFASNILS